MLITDRLSVSTIRSGKGECICIRFIGESGDTHNIFIDSGPTATAGEFRNLINNIQAKNEPLDALILTHYDEDHIGGILKVGDLGFKDIYFNAYDGSVETENLSAAQNQRVFHTLSASKIHTPILRGYKIELDGAKIAINAPTADMLEMALKKMKEAEVQLASVSDWSMPFDELMKKPYPNTDTSVANQASIVFTFEYDSKKVLFCGDAWPSSIPGGKYDLVKLPHHGSCRNISENLLSRLEANHFLICADGTTHPNKQTIAKLLQRYGKIKICSNYTWWMEGFLLPEDMKYIDNGDLVFLVG